MCDMRHPNAPGRTATVRYLVDAHPGEPLFCLRGRDLLAIPTVGQYMQFLKSTLRYHPRLINGPVFEAVQADFDAIVKWQGENAPLLKYPDRPFKG